MAFGLKTLNPPKGAFSRAASVSRLSCSKSLSRPLHTFVPPRPRGAASGPRGHRGAGPFARVRQELVFNKVILLPVTCLPLHPQTCTLLPRLLAPVLHHVLSLFGGPLAGSDAALAGAGHVPAVTALCSLSAACTGRVRWRGAVGAQRPQALVCAVLQRFLSSSGPTSPCISANRSASPAASPTAIGSSASRAAGATLPLLSPRLCGMAGKAFWSHLSHGHQS